jgi:hypothetical protein
MNAAELQQAGFSQEEISSYIVKRNLTLKSAGFSDAEIEAKYGPSEFSPANPKHADIDKFFNDGMKDVKIDPVDGDPQSNFSHILSPWINTWRAVGYSSAESLNRGMAGFATHLNTLAEYIGKKTGTKPGEIFEKAAEQYNQNTDYWKKRADEVGTSFFQELVSEAIGGAIPGISEFLLNVPYATFLGAAEAEKSGGNELGGALLSGAKRGLLGAVFKAMGPLNHYLRAPAMGITFGAQAVSEGADTRDIAKSVGIGAIYSMMSPGGRYGLNEMTNNARSYLNEQVTRINAAKAKTKSEPPGAETETEPSVAEAVPSNTTDIKNIIPAPELEKQVAGAPEVSRGGEQKIETAKIPLRDPERMPVDSSTIKIVPSGNRQGGMYAVSWTDKNGETQTTSKEFGFKEDAQVFADKLKNAIPKSKPSVTNIQLKQPWQMTKEEFIRDYYQKNEQNNKVSWKGKDFSAATANIEAKKLGEGWSVEESPNNKDRFVVVRKETLLPIDEYIKEYGNDLSIIHKQQIQQALKEGKSVPPETLAEYPELTKKELKTVQTKATSEEKVLNELIAKGKERGYVKDGVYTNFDENIKIGDEITMNFSGAPVDFPKPWKLKNAENYFSTVDYKNRVKLTVEASNGKVMVFDDARIYSPRSVEPVDKKESWQERRKQLVNLRDNLSRKADEQNKQDPSFPPAEYDSRVEEINSVIESGDLVNRKATILDGNTQEKLEEIHNSGMAEVLKKYPDLIPSETTRKSEGKIGKTEDSEKVKEPWQMTKEEYEAELTKYEKLVDNQEMKDSEGIPASQDAIDAYNRGDWETFSRARGYSEEAISNFRRWVQLASGDNFNYNDVTPENIHRQHVQQALSEGKPVPPDVLKEYGLGGKAKEPWEMKPQGDFRRTPGGPVETGKPIGRSEIKQLLEEKLAIPIRTGRFRQRGLGIFKPKEEVIRTKYANDIETISHEIGHGLHKFLWPESVKKGAEQFVPYKEELIPIATEPRAGQDIKAEGFAEFIRLYITDAKKAQEVAPRFYDYFDNILSEKSPEAREVLLEARKRYDIYMKQPALKRVLSQISINEKQGRETNTFDSFYTTIIDDLHQLEMVVREMAQGEKIPVSKDPYKLARLMRGWTGKAEAFLKNKPFDFGTYKDISGSKSLKEILDPIRDNLDFFRAYIVSKRTLELEGRKIDTGILHEDAVEIVNKYDKEFRTSFEDLKKFQDSTLDYLKQSGLIDQKSYDAMKTANADYVPFYRVMENQKGYGVGRGIQSWNPIKGIKGSWRDIQDPLESIIKNTFTYINLAEKNAVGRALVDLAKNKEGLGKFVEKIPTPTRGIEVKPEELQKWLKEIGLDGEIDPANIDNLTIFRPNAFMPKDNVIQVWENGKRELYQVHPDIAKTFQALDSESANMILRILAKPASWLRAGATLTPEFIARNPLRDQWSSFIYSKYGFVPVFDTARGLFAMAKKENLYWEWKKSGGDHSMLVSMDRDYLQDNLGELLQKYPVANLAKNPINALRILSELGEEGTRLGEFGAARRKLGESKEAIQEAGFSSREVTLDFNRIGAKTKAVNAIIAFWNAQVQGGDKMIRAFRDNPIGTTVRVAASITLPSVILAIANHDDPRLKEVPQWQKDLFWIIPTDSGIWRIPKPFELGIIFGSIPERITNFIIDNDPKSFDKTIETFTRGFSPGMIPTIATPILENWANKSFFFDRSIVSRSREELLPQYQYGEYTTETAKALGRLVGYFPGVGDSSAASPAYIENIVRGWTGGLGKYALDILDFGMKSTGITEKGYQEPSKTIADIPLIKAFAVRFPSSNTASIEKFYDNYKKAKEVEKTFKVLMEKEQKPQEAIKLWQEMGGADLDGVQKALGSMRNAIDLIHKHPDIKPEEKRQLIDTIYLQMIQIAKTGNEFYDSFDETRKRGIE